MRRMSIPLSLLILTLIITGAALNLCLQSSKTPANVPSDKDPCETVTMFFDALNRREYTACDDLLYECNTLGLGNVPEKKLEKIIWDEMLRSLSCEIAGDPEISADTADVKVIITALSLKKASEDINNLEKEIIKQAISNASENEKIVDENGHYIDEFVAVQYEKAAAEAMKAPEKYYQENECTINLRYKDGRWRIVVTDDFADIITGRK